MNHSKPPRRFFYGWVVVAASMFCVSTGTGPFAFASLGLFIIPFQEEFGWSRGQTSAALSVLLTTTAVCLPILGRIVDRYGARRVLMGSMVVLALSLAAIPLVVTKIWHLVVVFVVIGTLGAGTNSVPYMSVLSAWFYRQRGFAIGLAIAGIGLGYAYVPVLVQFMIDESGWRAGYYALSAIVFLVALPLAFFFLRESPQQMGLQPDGATDGQAPRATSRDVGLTRAEVLRHREFWMLAVIFVILSFVLNGLLSHLVPLLVDRGMNAKTAASVAAVEGITVFFSRIGIGYLIDRFFAPRVAMAFFTLSALGIALLATGAVDGMAFMAAFLVGLSLGAEVDLLAYLTGRYFGLKSFGSTYGLLFAAILAGTALGPLAFGVGFELTGSYTEILLVCIVINLLAVAITGLLGRYPDWECAPVAASDRRVDPRTP
ncbi:MAG: MFS transporter [Steroidobacteraceae bacterium]